MRLYFYRVDSSSSKVGGENEWDGERSKAFVIGRICSRGGRCDLS